MAVVWRWSLVACLAWVGRLAFVLLASPAGQALSTRATSILPANRKSDRLLQTAVTLPSPSPTTRSDVPTPNPTAVPTTPTALPVVYYPASLYPTGVQLVANNIVGFVSLPSSYVVSLDLYPQSVISLWGGILGLVGAGKRMYAYFQPSDLTLWVAYNLASGEYRIDPPAAVLPLAKWSTLTITVDCNLGLIAFSVVGGVTINARSRTFPIPSPCTDQSVQVSAAPGSDSQRGSADTKIRNLAIAPPAALPVNYYPADSYPSGLTPYQGNLVGLVSLPASYALSFDLMHTADGTGSRSIVHLTATGGDADGAGSRLPAVYFNAAAPTLGLYVSLISSGAANGNERKITPTQAQPLNAWSTVLITVDSVNLLMTLTVIGGVSIPTMSVAFPTPAQQTWPSVIVYASDPWFTAAPAKIRNLAVSALNPSKINAALLPVSYYPSVSYPSGFVLTAANLLGFVSLPASYALSFDLMPTADGTGSRSIVHLTATGGDADGTGSRLPAVYFNAAAPTLGLYVSLISSGAANGNERKITPTQALPLNAWSTVLITVDSVNLLMTLTVIGGVNIPTMSVAFPSPSQQTWPSVMVFASDPWTAATAAKIRNLVVSPPCTALGQVVSYTSSAASVFRPCFSGNVQVLVVGGGAGGEPTDNDNRYTRSSGGGGAGGLLYASSIFLTAGVSYPVTVGQGGNNGQNGGDSSFGTFVAKGGGTGGAYDIGTASAGGSGGGGGNCCGSVGGTGSSRGYGAASNQPSYTGWLSFGNKGGDKSPSGYDFAAAGGGGAGGVGGTAVGGTASGGGLAGAGGSGWSSTMSGSLYTYAAGGGGGNDCGVGGSGGTGGGGSGGGDGKSEGSDATSYGSGGGGAGRPCNTDGVFSGGKGMQGVVVVSASAALPTSNYPASSFPNGFVLTAANFLGFVSLPASYALSFDLMHTADGTGSRSIVHLTATGGDADGAGSRLPAVYFNAAAPTLGLYVSLISSGAANGNERKITPTQALPLNAWSTVLITVDSVNMFLTLTVSGGVTIPTQSVSFPAPAQQAWPSVMVYASDPWLSVAVAKIRNLVISAISPAKSSAATLPVTYFPSTSYPSGFALTQGNLIGIVSLPAAYTLSFDLMPTADGSGWRDIVTLTATGGDAFSGAGCRLPDIAFCAADYCPSLGFAVEYSGQGAYADGVNFGQLPYASPLNVWSTFLISVDSINLLMTLTVSGGVTIPQKTLNLPAQTQNTWPSVKVYASSPWYAAGAANIRNLAISPLTALPARYVLIPPSILGAAALFGSVTLPASYTLSFDLKPLAAISDCNTVLHLTGNGQNLGAGSRLPMVGFCGGSCPCADGGIWISYFGSGAADSVTLNTIPLPINSNNTVLITVDTNLKIFTVGVMGATSMVTRLISFSGAVSSTWPTVLVYGADPWSVGANALVRNLVISPPAPLPVKYSPSSSGVVIAKGNLLGVVSLPKSYALSFDLYPTADGASVRNIVHLTATGTDGGAAGSRLPAVYFCATGSSRCSALNLAISYMGSSFMVSNQANQSLSLNSWVTVTVTISTSSLTLSLSGSTIIPGQSISIPAPLQTTWASVQVFASDPWAYPATATIRNLVIAERGSENGDANILCELYATFASPTQLSNWCGTKNADGSFVKSVCNAAAPWTGVTCGLVGGINRVKAVALTSKGLGGGSIPLSIGGLDALTLFNLASNSIGSSIPASIGLLTALQSLALQNNKLTSSIPSSLASCSALNFLTLQVNSLSGRLPSELAALSKLSVLQVNSNNFVGQVPISWCAFSSTLVLAINANPSLTCFPSCVASFSLTKDSTQGICTVSPTVLPSVAPTAPTAIPTLFPTSFETNEGGILCSFWNTMNPASKTAMTNWCGALNSDGSYANGPCSSTNPWLGVMCATVGGNSRVVSLDLSGKGLVGSIPSLIGNLDALTSLNMISNSLAGLLPFQLGQLTSLQVLALYNNKFTGSCPSTFGNLRSLTILNFAANSLSKNLPSQLGLLTQLQLLALDRNSFTGSIPSQLGFLTTLRFISLNSNLFTSAVPASFCSFQPSIDLQLQSNNLQCFPSCLTLSRYTKLQRDPSLRVCGDEQALCDFYKTLSASSKTMLTNWCGTTTTASSACGDGDWLGVTCTSGRVVQIDLTGKSLVGTLPTTLGTLDAITALKFGGNILSGSIVSQVGLLTNLQVLELYSNRLTSTLPTTIGNLAALTTVRVQSNSLSGSLPSQIGFLSSLASLDVSLNLFSSSLPLAIFNLKMLNYLSAAGTQIGGSLPSQLGLLTNLANLIFWGSKLTGTIPTTVGNMAALNSLNLGGNNIGGSIPSEMSALTNLRALYLGNNKLEGPLSSTLISSLRLLIYFEVASNLLTGPLPTALGGLKRLLTLCISKNDFTGSLPPLCQLPSTLILQAQGSGLTGCVPFCMAAFTALSTGLPPCPSPSPSSAPTVQMLNPTARPSARPTNPTPLPSTYPTGLSLPFPQSFSFAFTGAVQQFRVPAGVTSVQVDACGGQGGGSRGGLGGFISAILPVKPQQMLFVYVGGQGSTFNGGGTGTISAGGGASDVRSVIEGLSGNGTESLASRLVVAGGGGASVDSGGNSRFGGAGGGLVGGSGIWDNQAQDGQGGSQIAGGAGGTQYCVTALGLLGAGGACDLGGGGGHYGGGGAVYAAGGGSSFAVGPAAIVQNIQGDARCAGSGVVYISLLGIYAPTPIPTSIPTVQPSPLPTTRPTARPSPFPSANPTPEPSTKPTVLPTPEPSPVPSPMPTYLPLQTLSKVACSNKYDGLSATYVVPSVAFTNLNAGANLNWFLTAEVYGTGWGSQNPKIGITVVGSSTAVKYCAPTDSCNSQFTFPTGAGPARCIMNMPLSPADLNSANGGSIVINANTYGFPSTGCKFNGFDIFLNFTLTATRQQPSYFPTPSPTSAPVQSSNTGTAPPTRFPTAEPTAPTIAPTPIPTTIPSPLPSPFPTYLATATFEKVLSAATFDPSTNGYPLGSVSVPNLYGAPGMVWYVLASVYRTDWLASGAGKPYLLLTLSGGSSGSKALDKFKCYPSAGGCDAQGNIIGGLGSVPFVCTEWAITQEMLNPINGGTITIAAATVGFSSTSCNYRAQDVYVVFDFRGTSDSEPLTRTQLAANICPDSATNNETVADAQQAANSNSDCSAHLQSDDISNDPTFSSSNCAADENSFCFALCASDTSPFGKSHGFAKFIAHACPFHSTER